MKDYLIWVKHGEGSSTSYAEANSMHADGLNRDDRTRHQRPQTDPVMADLSDDHVGVQNACEDIDEVLVDESEQAEFFEALLHSYSDPSMFLLMCIKTGKKKKKTQKKTKESSKTNSNEEVDYYAQRRIPALVMWYLPMVDRLRFLFANPEDAELMCWHGSDERKHDGKL